LKPEDRSENDTDRDQHNHHASKHQAAFFRQFPEFPSAFLRRGYFRVFKMGDRHNVDSCGWAYPFGTSAAGRLVKIIWSAQMADLGAITGRLPIAKKRSPAATPWLGCGLADATSS
jgi:hypothetical protein